VSDISFPEINYAAIAPMLILFGAAMIGVLIEAFVPRSVRNPVQLVLALGSMVVALIAVVMQGGTRTVTAGEAVAIDGPTLFLQGAILVLGVMAMLLIGERSLETGGAFVAQAAIVVNSPEDRKQAQSRGGATEVYPLALFAIAGMLLFVAANDLLTMFIALEAFSLPLYLLCALARRRRLLSQEAALKYFLLGAYSSAFFLFGLALTYGFTAGWTARPGRGSTSGPSARRWRPPTPARCCSSPASR
jgi:NADH-quinone oxidoreductase subunit N